MTKECCYRHQNMTRGCTFVALVTILNFICWQSLLIFDTVTSFSIVTTSSSCHKRCNELSPLIPSINNRHDQRNFDVINQDSFRRLDVSLTATTRSSSSSSKSSNVEDGLIDAVDIEGIQNLFRKYCDKDGFMTKSMLESIPPFVNLLAEGDLLQEEWNDIWNAAPKKEGSSRVDVDSFVQIYRDVNDLFEDEEENDDDDDDDDDVVKPNNENTKISSKESSEIGNGSTKDDDDTENDFDDELQKVFESICNDSKLISKNTLKNWEEIQKLLIEGLLGEDEFDELWEKTTKSAGTEDEFLDLDGFLSFNVALDGLFEFEDDDDIDDNNDADISSIAEKTPRALVVEGDMPPGVLFSQLADDDYLVGMDELKLWVELQDMIEEGDLLPSELQEMYDKIVSSDSGKLSEEQFLELYKSIDYLFEDDDTADGGVINTSLEGTNAGPEQKNNVKKDLLAFLDIIEEDGEDMLPCGLDATDADQKQVLNIVNALQQQPSNLIKQKQGNIELSDLAGIWELLYSSSSAMKFNKGLSGLGGSFPNGKFAGVKQELKSTKFLTDMEYKERIEVNPSTASFDVSVTGSWDLRTSVSLFTGDPSIVLRVEPERVIYGPTSTRADHWKSLGPLNMLDLSYLDDDLRIMRGCTSSETLFIFKKVL